MFSRFADGSHLARRPQAKTNIDGQILLLAVRGQIGVVIRVTYHVPIMTPTHSLRNSASMHPEACSPPHLDVAHQLSALQTTRRAR